MFERFKGIISDLHKYQNFINSMITLIGEDMR